MSEIKLKPCPFCNSEVKMMDIGEGKDDHYYMIQCQNPSCDSATCYGENSKEEAIEHWNTRKPMERIVERVEAARQKYQRLCKEQGEKEDEAMNTIFRGVIRIVKEEGGV